jgi:hypothetical protein
VNLLNRVKNILLAPREEWPVIAGEPATPQTLYLSYIMILAAIGPVVLLLAGGLSGFAIRLAVAAYINSLIGVAVLALIVDVLSTNFGGSKDFVASLKLTAYSFTPSWVASIALFLPVVGGLIILAAAIYGFYLLFLGAPVLKKSAPDKAVLFTIIVLLCAIVLWYLVQTMLAGLGIGYGARMGNMSITLLQ